MFKLNKATHMLILMTFTIVFVVVYMYYMIKDVKKIYAEVKAQGTEIANLKSLASEVQEVKGLVSGLLSTPPPMVTEAMFMQQFMPMPAPAPQSNNIKPVVVEEAPKDDDVDSVATEDIKKLVEDDEEAQETATEAIPQVENVVPDEESLKKMKLDDIKEVCKKMGISTKGTRDSLVSKILEAKTQ